MTVRRVRRNLRPWRLTPQTLIDRRYKLGLATTPYPSRLKPALYSVPPNPSRRNTSSQTKSKVFAWNPKFPR